jgi:hypothetical protein
MSVKVDDTKTWSFLFTASPRARLLSHFDVQGLLGYDVIRAVMAEAAGAHGQMPHRVSFKGALQALLAHAEALREGSPMGRRRLWGSC